MAPLYKILARCQVGKAQKQIPTCLPSRKPALQRVHNASCPGTLGKSAPSSMRLRPQRKRVSRWIPVRIRPMAGVPRGELEVELEVPKGQAHSRHPFQDTLARVLALTPERASQKPSG